MDVQLANCVHCVLLYASTLLETASSTQSLFNSNPSFYLDLSASFRLKNSFLVRPSPHCASETSSRSDYVSF